MAIFRDTIINDTGYLTLPVGDTSQRPSPTAGMIRVNNTNNLLEFYDSSGWRPITGVSKGSIGTGGDSILYATSNLGRANGVVHMFTTAGSFTFTPAFSGTVEVLVIGGGGTGGGHLGGGGGAGGMTFNRSYSVTSGTNIPVTVGAGGAAVAAYGTSNPGSNSVFGSITATGGGGAGSWDGHAAKSGGSGGGGCTGSTGAGSNSHTGPNDSRNTNLGGRGITGQGFPGGSGIRFNRQAEDSHKSGGGGGSGGPGFSGEDDCHQGLQSNGGPGTANDILGYTLYWAGGGAGSQHQGNTTVANSGGIGGGGGSTQSHGGPRQPTTSHGNGLGGGQSLNTGGAGTPGTNPNTGGNGGVNTGSGGGGAYGTAGTGGSGIVIVRY
jgi:hypothetical protein